MSTPGTFTSEDADIVKLESDREGEHERQGWVNVGNHAVLIQLDHEGNLTIESYARTCEDRCLGTITVTKAQATAAGGIDPDSEA